MPSSQRPKQNHLLAALPAVDPVPPSNVRERTDPIVGTAHP